MGDQQNKPKYAGPPELIKVVLPKSMLGVRRGEEIGIPHCAHETVFIKHHLVPSTHKHCLPPPPPHFRHPESPQLVPV